MIGKPGVGKYTIAKEIAKSGYVICDNQLINNPIFTLLNYDGFAEVSDKAWHYIDKIRDVVFDFIASETEHNYVLTNVLNEDEEDRQLFEDVKNIAKKRHAIFVPVKLTISREEHLKRIQNRDRLKRFKSIDPDDVNDNVGLINIKHDNLIEIDVSALEASAASEKILRHCNDISQ